MLGQTTTTTASPSGGIASTIQSVAEAVGGTLSTLQLDALNYERLKSGQQPLTSSQAAALQPTVNVGISSSTQSMLLLVAGIAALLFLLK